MVNLLECRLQSWSHFREQIPHDKPVDFLCYHWQEPMIQTYFTNQRPLTNPRGFRVSIEIAKEIAGLTPS